MTEVTKADPWECFSDASYYDMWCVRLKTDRTFGAGIHVLRQEEAEHLRDFLNARTTAEAAKDARIAELEALLARAKQAFSHISKQWPDSFAARSARAALKEIDNAG